MNYRSLVLTFKLYNLQVLPGHEKSSEVSEWFHVIINFSMFLFIITFRSLYPLIIALKIANISLYYIPGHELLTIYLRINSVFYFFGQF